MSGLGIILLDYSLSSRSRKTSEKLFERQRCLSLLGHEKTFHCACRKFFNLTPLFKQPECFQFVWFNVKIFLMKWHSRGCISSSSPSAVPGDWGRSCIIMLLFFVKHESRDVTFIICKQMSAFSHDPMIFFIAPKLKRPRKIQNFGVSIIRLVKT